MKVLVDAHALLWFVWGHANLSHAARQIMEDRDNELLLSIATLWEIGIKVGIGRLRLAEPYEAFMQSAITENDLTVLPIALKHIATVTTLSLHHRDPFDRLLVAQAIVEQAPILSADSAMDDYPVQRLW